MTEFWKHFHVFLDLCQLKCKVTGLGPEIHWREQNTGTGQVVIRKGVLIVEEGSWVKLARLKGLGNRERWNYFETKLCQLTASDRGRTIDKNFFTFGWKDVSTSKKFTPPLDMGHMACAFDISGMRIRAYKGKIVWIVCASMCGCACACLYTYSKNADICCPTQKSLLGYPIL